MMRITSNMISRGMEDINNNPYFKKKVEESKDDKSTDKTEENDYIMISNNVMAEQVNDTIVLSKINSSGYKEAIKTVDSDSTFGQQLSSMIDEENMSDEDVLKERIKEITMNNNRMNLANYL
ncbi:MAG: hypothetical protein JXO44_12120 [Clostridia bacterium]|nr:hypothetical protein [Clostridia bacterium]